MNPKLRASRTAGLGRIAVLLVAGLAVGAGAGLGAQEALRVSPSLDQGVPAVPDLQAVEGQVRLTLEDAVAVALKRNLSLQVQRYDRERARLGIDQALGIYDFSLTAGLQASNDVSPAASNLDGAEVQETDRAGWQLGLSQLVPTGGVAELAWNNSRLETNSVFALLNPSYNAGLDFIFSQPLLRDFGRPVTDRAIVISRNVDEISRLNFIQKVTDLLRDTENAYWTLIDARYQLQVAEASLDLARQLHEQNRVRVEVGTLAPLELVQSEVGISTREEEIIRARFAVGDAEDRLRQILGLDRGDLWSAEIVPETPAETEALKISLDDALDTALRERPEIAIKRVGMENLSVDAAYYRNQKLPRLDMRAVYGFNGVGGDAIVTDAAGNPIGEIPGDWTDAMQQVGEGDYRGWSVGVSFAFPLQNRTAKARSAEADLTLAQSEVELKELELAVSTEVRASARLVEAAAKAIETARASRRLAERNLEAEQKKYENGLSTSFQVLEIQDDLTQARSRLANSVTGYRKALVVFHRATGRLVSESGIEVVADQAPPAAR